MRLVYYLIIAYNLSTTEAKIVKFLYDSAPDFATPENIIAFAWGGQARCETIAAKLIHSARYKLIRHNIIIQTQYGKGYALSQSSADRLRQLFTESDNAEL